MPSVEQCVDLLKKRGIQVCVFDMDQTAVAAHSRGRLRRDTANLQPFLEKATPGFLSLVRLLLVNSSDNFQVAIATHSDEIEYGRHDNSAPATHILGTELAQKLIDFHFPPEIARKIYIIAFNPRVRKVSREQDLIKRLHMRKIMERFEIQDPKKIVFFDDVAHIVQDCRQYCQVNAIQVDQNIGFTLQDLWDGLHENQQEEKEG